MFTGLVEGQGSVLEVISLAAGVRLKLMPESGCFAGSLPIIGDSISISGCCLTVVKADDGGLEFEAGEETLSKTSLKHLRVGSRVNLERSLTPASRLGGHFVQGHVDGTAVVHQIQRSHDWVDMWFRTSPELLEMMVTKGSVAVDGVSLTIVHVEPERFSVALIPHTLKMTTLGERQSGDVVNIENDILGKYVARLLSQRFSPGTGSR